MRFAGAFHTQVTTFQLWICEIEIRCEIKHRAGVSDREKDRVTSLSNKRTGQAVSTKV